MKDGFALDGVAAIDWIVARAAPAIVAGWDGETERVAFILHRDDDAFDVAFAERAEAIRQLRRLAQASLTGEAGRLLAHAVALERRAPHGVHCVLLGFGEAVLVEIEPEDLRSGVAAERVRDEQLAELLAQLTTREGALHELAEVRLLLRAETGAEVAELVALEDVIERAWTDIAALGSAIERARRAAEPVLPTAAGQRARLVLDMLDQATRRRGGIVNAPGGTA